jgi:hypothetical protein
MPPMAWVLRARAPDAHLVVGRLVRASETGIFEGTWAGDDRSPLGPLRSTTPFGSGVLASGDVLHIVPPGHMLEGIYVVRSAGELRASNSLACLLRVAGLRLDPTAAYPPLFNRSVQRIRHTTIPSLTQPVEAHFLDNLRLTADGQLTAVPKPREKPFATFGEYRQRLSASLAQAIANAEPGDPMVTISSGYDGAAVAVLAHELGCRKAVTIRQGKPVKGSDSLDDSGEPVAQQLGLEVTAVDRLDYQSRDDLVEADFLSTGFTGEEVVMSGLSSSLAGQMLITGFFGDGMWWLNRPPRPLLWRGDQSGSSLGEWRLRVGFVHVPLPCFAAEQQRSTQEISRSSEMRPWVLGRRYDKPIPRRILEEAGVERGTFGEVKRAASASIHSEGLSALSYAARGSIQEFAAGEGRVVRFRQRDFPLWRRASVKWARRVRAESLAWRLSQPKYERAVLEPEFGSLLLRWAISVVQRRYDEVTSDASFNSAHQRHLDER